MICISTVCRIHGLLRHLLPLRKAQKALEEVERVKKDTQAAIIRARQEAQLTAETEITKAREEIRLARDTAENAVRQAQEEAGRYREEVETANNHARLAISLAQEKVKAVSEEIKAIQEQTQIDIARARADVLKSREEAETARRASRKAISRAEAESRKAREETEFVKMTAAEAIRRAQEESRKIKENADINITKINESLSQAQRNVINMIQGDISRDRQVVQETPQTLNGSVEESTAALPETDDNPVITHEKNQKILLDEIIKMHNPLHSISGFARMILDDNICDTAAQKEILTTILQQTENLKIQLDNIHRSIRVDSP